MNTEKWFGTKLAEFRDDPGFYAEELILDVTEQIISVMKQRGLSRKELADRLGVSKAFVTKLLNGNANITLKTMAAIARSLEWDVVLDIRPRDTEPAKIPRSTRSRQLASFKSRRGRPRAEGRRT